MDTTSEFIALHPSALFASHFGSFWIADVHRILNPSSSIPKLWDTRKSQVAAKTKTNRDFKAKQKIVPKNAQKRKSSDADADYGGAVLEGDVEEESLPILIQTEMESRSVTKEKQDEIEQATRGQFDEERWYLERRGRITASVVGKIWKMMKSTNNSCLIKQLLYTVENKELSFNDPRARGRRQEPIALAKYEEARNVKVTPCGLFVSLQNGIFAASPDGLVGADGMVEVKCVDCPINLVPKRKSNAFLELDKTGQLRLKRRDNYYYQV